MTEETSKVDSLSDTLYSRTRYQDPLEKRSAVKELELPEVEEKWQGNGLDELLGRERKVDESHPFMKKFFIFAVLFFAATVVIAGIVFFGGVNFVSSKNVDINVVGPTTASSGEVLELGVTIENKNNTDLELANFSVTFPQGSRDPKDTGKTLTYLREDLGVVKAGDEAVRNVSVVLLGSMGESKELKFSVEYKVKGSNATFYKEKFYQVAIGNTPITLKITSPQMVSSGEVFETVVEVTLNSTEVLKNALMRAEYPYGYSVTETAPQAAADGNLWALGDLSPGSTKKIRIKGKLTGVNQEERTFRFYIGVGENNSLSPNFKTVVLSDQATVLIERPAVGMTILFNGQNVSPYVVGAGKTVQVSVKFQNNLSETLLNPSLEVRLSGASLDKSSVEVQNGTYNPSTNRISWSLAEIIGESELSPGEDGQVTFSFAPLAGITPTGANQDIPLQVSLTGTPVGSLQSVAVSENRIVKVASQVTLSSRTVYSLGPFVNSGSMPPKVGETTSYTVVWTVDNTQGDVGNSKVTARLGSNVKWVGAKSFANDSIAYDQKTNTVTWSLGTLSADGGPREVAFQISLTPTASQFGTTPTLVTNILFSGIDSSTGKNLSVTNPPLTTRMPSDPAFVSGHEVVVK